MDRQQFIRATIGATAGGPFTFTDLIALAKPTPVPSVVGHVGVAEVCNAARAFAGWDNRYGGGLLREAAVAQLRYCAELLNARCSENVQADLFSRVHALAKLGRVQDTAYAVGVADEEFSHARPADDPVTVRYYDAAVHTDVSGYARWDVAIHHGHFIAEARHRLSTVVTGHREEFARARVRSQLKLASLVMGDR